MERNVKIVAGVIAVVIGVALLLSNYYLKLKHEVFDDMNKLYYEKTIAIDDLEIIDEVVTTTTSVVETETTTTTTTTTVKAETYIGYIKIPKINLNRGFYDKDSKYNNVNRNIYVHPNSSYPNTKGNNLILASHSGTSSISYFKNLYKLELNDSIYINYNNKEYHYKIKNIYNVPKDGTVALRINEEISTLSLITCTKNDKNSQTVYICELVE